MVFSCLSLSQHHSKPCLLPNASQPNSVSKVGEEILNLQKQRHVGLAFVVVCGLQSIQLVEGGWRVLI